MAVLQAELRAIAARLIMPEFMLTSDASNANYSSTMVAEGPAVKLFSRLQRDTFESDLELLWFAIRHAISVGRIPEVTPDQIIIDVTLPTLETHDRKAEIEGDQILVQNKAMSRRTMGEKQSLDMDAEEEQIATEREAADPFGLSPLDAARAARDAEGGDDDD